MPGFDTNRFINLTESESNHLICSICLNIFDGAIKGKCEHTFCKSCVQQWIESNHKECPECRKEFKTRKRSDSTESTDNLVLIGNYIFKKNLLANSMVSELNTKCEFDFNGCQQSIKLGSLSSHVKDCPHRFCAKCDFTFINSVEHNCIELLKNDRNDFKERFELEYELNEDIKNRYENQLEVINDLKVENEKQLEIINKLKEEKCELMTRWHYLISNLNNRTDSPIGDQDDSNPECNCPSIRYINFGLFKTTISDLELDQDSFNFMSVKANINESLHDIRLPFDECEEFRYCNHPSLRIIMIRPNDDNSNEIQTTLGLDDNNIQFYKHLFTAETIYPPQNFILLVFREDSPLFERCVHIMESFKHKIEVEVIDERNAKNYIHCANDIKFLNSF